MPPLKPRRKLIEQTLQQQLIQICHLYSGQEPLFGRLYHIPNGGYRSPVEAGILKSMGVRAGVPDLLLPVGCGTYNSLYIEMKRPGGKLSENQEDWIAFLRFEGHCVQICESVDAAWTVLCWYLWPGLETQCFVEQVTKVALHRTPSPCGKAVEVRDQITHSLWFRGSEFEANSFLKFYQSKPE
jgi:hypothetical protein